MTNSSAFILNATEMPKSSVTRFASSFCALPERLSSTPHSRTRLPNIRKPMSSADLGAIVPATMVTKIGKMIFVALGTASG